MYCNKYTNPCNSHLMFYSAVLCSLSYCIQGIPEIPFAYLCNIGLPVGAPSMAERWIVRCNVYKCFILFSQRPAIFRARIIKFEWKNKSTVLKSGYRAQFFVVICCFYRPPDLRLGTHAYRRRGAAKHVPNNVPSSMSLKSKETKGGPKSNDKSIKEHFTVSDRNLRSVSNNNNPHSPIVNEWVVLNDILLKLNELVKDVAEVKNEIRSVKNSVRELVIEVISKLEVNSEQHKSAIIKRLDAVETYL